MTSLLVIPARGGSKRIPHKNIRDFCGTPILARVIETVKMSGVAAEVVVSTDSDAIADVAEAAGAQVPFRRSPENSGDFATLHSVVVEAIQRTGAGKHSHVICMLPTAVLVRPDTLARADKQYRESDADSLISVARFRHPVERALTVNESGHLTRRDATQQGLRTQDATTLFYDAGQFYFARIPDLLNRTSLMGQSCLPFELSYLEGYDIDFPDDWVVAEALFLGRERVRGR